MRKIFTLFLLVVLFFQCGNSQQVLVYHTIQTDNNGNMIPWYNPDPSVAYDHDLQLIWNFWKNIPSSSGTKFYMMDHSYSPTLQSNMVGGDQFAMAINSWTLYYQYTGDASLIDNMKYIADTYLANSLSSGSDTWPNIPYPCNASQTSLPIYDGDYVLGAGFTQPDKAGSIGFELLTLYKITGQSNYLNTAIGIANTLATKVSAGDSTTSPYPFKVNAHTGAMPTGLGALPGANYTTNFVSTLLLFEQLSAMQQGNTAQYDSAYNTIKTWIQRYPEHDNNWGCFFEDIVGYSNTETNAVNMARYILNHPNWSNTYKQEARAILDWTFNTFQDTVWNQYGATAIFEQSADLKPGGSHTSRYASTELIYTEKTGDTTHVAEAIRQLNWATYLCDTSGMVRFSPSENSVWYTDGYGDYVRHYLRAMGAYPQIAPADANHLLQTSSVVTSITYNTQEIDYNTYDSASYETLRLISKPTNVLVDGIAVSEQSNLNAQAWTWADYATGGVLKLKHTNGHSVNINWYPLAVNTVAGNDFNAQVFPNPTNGLVKLSYTLPEAKDVLIEVFNVAGQKISSNHMQAMSGLNTATINVANQAEGVYVVKLTTNIGSYTQRLIVTK